MYHCECLSVNNTYIDEVAYSPNEIALNKLLTLDYIKGYVSYPATFDIETTTLLGENPTAFMYIWQFCIKGTVFFGRTWRELLGFLDDIADFLNLSKDHKLVIYVHNLSFEFEFIRKFIQFTNIFATAPHKVLKASTDKFEFRCSYYLSNMSLLKFIENTPGAIHLKSKDDLDYKVIRTPETELMPRQYGYCYNDVRGLEEAILYLLQKDTLRTIPLTSTGYVRRDCRLAMRKNKKNRKSFINSRLTYDQFVLCEECFRGGNTASSRFYCNDLLEKVGSYDLSSSYPYQMMAKEYPIGAFIKYTVKSEDELKHLNNAYCTIGRYMFTNVNIKKNVPIPYIPVSKITTNNCTAFNGRVLKADYVSISLTNIDYEIIKSQYDFDDLYVKDFYIARKGELPKELKAVIMDYYEKKTTLKGIEEHIYEYFVSKQKLNSIYGMTVTNPCKSEMRFDDKTGEWSQDDSNRSELLDKFYKSWNSFMPFQVGIFVTANARKQLQEGIDKIGLDVVYCDTDSIKYINDHEQDFKELNDKINKSFCASRNGVSYPMGVWDSENQKGKHYEYDQFKTLGAKKYAFVKDGKIGITVAGLSKKDGAKELEKMGGIKKFENGAVFINSGRSVAYFNNEEIHKITVDGVEIETGSNIAIVDTTYTLGITDTMLDIIDLERNKEYE